MRGFILDTEKIRVLALNKGLTEQELLKEAGLNALVISRARTKGTRVSVKSIKKIAGVLECEPSDLIIQGGEINAED